MAFELPFGADFGCNRHCKTNPVDLEGSRARVLSLLGAFREAGGRGKTNFPLWPKAGYVKRLWTPGRCASQNKILSPVPSLSDLTVTPSEPTACPDDQTPNHIKTDYNPIINQLEQYTNIVIPY